MLAPTSVGLIVAAVAIAASLVAPSSSPSTPSFNRPPSAGAQAVPQAPTPRAIEPVPPEARRGRLPAPAPDAERALSPAGRVITEADGVLPDHVPAFDDRYPGIANLESGLLEALRDATKDAAGDGIELLVNSGWRSAAYQEQLLRDAVAAYGSEAEAARWVATADTSPHVSGAAVDVGPSRAIAWLSEHGADYGLCQVYGNEPWHYELRSEAIGGRCPRVYRDPTHDPRMNP